MRVSLPQARADRVAQDPAALLLQIARGISVLSLAIWTAHELR